MLYTPPRTAIWVGLQSCPSSVYSIKRRNHGSLIQRFQPLFTRILLHHCCAVTFVYACFLFVSTMSRSKIRSSIAYTSRDVSGRGKPMQEKPSTLLSRCRWRSRLLREISTVPAAAQLSPASRSSKIGYLHDPSLIHPAHLSSHQSSQLPALTRARTRCRRRRTRQGGQHG